MKKKKNKRRDERMKKPVPASIEHSDLADVNEQKASDKWRIIEEGVS